jgi:hypothetical protein
MSRTAKFTRAPSASAPAPKPEKEIRHDCDLVWVGPATPAPAKRCDAERHDAEHEDAREDPLRELREYLARPIQAWELDDRHGVRTEMLRARIFRKEARGE